MPVSEAEELELLRLRKRKAMTNSSGGPQTPLEAPKEPPAPSTFDVFKNAAYKGAAGIPDMVLDAPNRLINLVKAGVGTVANVAGRPDLAPDITPDPDIARRGLESLGLIKPGVTPQGGIQRAVDVLTQGAVGGALTGGTTMPQVAAGAVMGALSSGAGAVTEAATGSPTAGAIAGMAVPGGVGKVAGGGRKLPQNVEMLNKEGVAMTPGQILGGTAKDIESAATSWPVLGSAIKGAQRHGLETFGEAAFNRSLEPVGEKLPKNLTGHKAVEYVEQTLGEYYDRILEKSHGSLHATGSKMPTVPGQPTTSTTLDGELTNLRQMAVAGNMPPEQLSQLDAILQREIRGRFNQHGLASGETLKEIDSFLGKFAKKKALSDNYYDNQLGMAVKEAQASLKRMIERENPKHAAELNKVDEGWANFKRVQGASASVGAHEGVFTPAQLQRSVKTKGKTRDDAAFARGKALMQDLSGAGKDVLSPSVPDSGTALRNAVRDIWQHPLQGVAGGLGSAIYAPPVQRAIQKMLTGNNPAIREAAKRSIIPLAETEGDK